LIIRIKMNKRRLKKEADDEQEEFKQEIFELDKLTEAQIKNAEKLWSWDVFRNKMNNSWFKIANDYISDWYSDSRIWKVVSTFNNK